MARLAEQAKGERQARMMLSMIAEPDDATTGRILHRVGGVETLRLLEDEQAAAPEMNRADAIAWRNRVAPGIEDGIPTRVADAERAGMSTLIPTDTDWPHALNDLGPEPPICCGRVGRPRSFPAHLLIASRSPAPEPPASTARMSPHTSPATSPNRSAPSSPAGPIASTPPPTGRHSRPAGAPSRSWPAVSIGPTRAGTRTCWIGSGMSGHWSVRLLLGRRRRGGGSWPARVFSARSRVPR